MARVFAVATSLCAAARPQTESANMLQVTSVSGHSDRNEYLASMKKKVLDVAKSGVPTEAVSFLTNIASILNDDVLPTLVAEKEGQKGQHDQMFAGFAAAQQWYQGITIDATPTDNAKAAHLSCRTLEKGDRDRKNTCDDEEGSALADYNGKESAVRAASEGAGVCVADDYDWRNSAHLASYQANVGAYKTAIDNVIADRATLEAKIAECDGLDGVLNAKVNECNGDQTTYENAACQYALDIQAEATNYTSSYGTIAGEFTGSISGWQEQFANRVHQCGTVKTLICYVNALIENNVQADLSGAISACDGETPDCSEMIFAISDVPAAVATTPVPAAPCAADFDYGTMPAGTTTGNCNACIGLGN